MKPLLLLLALAGLAFQDSMPPPNPNPLPGHGRYENVPGVRCYKGETDPHYRLVHCECVRSCDPAAMEDRSCETSCAKEQCKCHVDESCDEDMPMPENPR
jgi:hypothetical protein